jgi:hypothetical protein
MQGIALHDKESMMVSIVSGSTYSTATTPQTTSATSAASPSASSAAATGTQSSKAVISYQGTVLSSLFDAADEFIQKEHFNVFAGYRFTNGSSGYTIDAEGAYLDVEKFNNYLFDKAATTLVAQAKEKGIELDKKDVLAQLKENNAEIAEIKFDYGKLMENLPYNSIYRRLTYSDVQSLTDVYIMAKESGEELREIGKSNFVTALASKLAGYRFAQTVTMGYERHPGDTPAATVKLAAEISSKMVNSFGLGMDFFNNILDPNTGLALNAAENADVFEYKFLQFLSKMVDIKQGRTPTEYEGLPPDFVPVDRSRTATAPKSSATDGLSENAKAWQESEARFDRYRNRISTYACNFFTRGDRKVVGEAYEIAERFGEGAMKKIDKLANELAAFRIRQHMQGELVMLAVNQARGQQGKDDPDAPYQVDLAHLPLLGKIREMAGPGG